MNKRNFSKWVFLAARFKYGKILIDKSDKKFTKSMRNFCSCLIFDNMLVKDKADWLQEGALYISPTKKFYVHFLMNFEEVSKKIRPDFTDEVRNKMLESFKIKIDD